MTRTDLAPPRHHPDLFLIDLIDAPLKELISHLEHPFFSLSTRPRHQIARYEDKRGNFLELRPDPEYGLPTIFDQDLCIYAASAVLAEVNAGREPPRQLQFHTSDFIALSNRQRSGVQYDLVEAAILRLTTTRMRTNIVGATHEQMRIFGMVDSASIVRKRDLKPGDPSHLVRCEIVLSDWMMDAILSRRILTLHEDYFRLRRPMDRRMYQIARKHCGKQREWRIALPNLWIKSGSTAQRRDFRGAYRDFVARWQRNADDPAIGPFLEYDTDYDEKRDIAIFRSRRPDTPEQDLKEFPSWPIEFDPPWARIAQENCNWDVDLVAEAFRKMLEKNRIPRDAPNIATRFAGFCRSLTKM